MYLSFYKVYP
jgi:hypothetical protein